MINHTAEEGTEDACGHTDAPYRHLELAGLEQKQRVFIFSPLGLSQTMLLFIFHFFFVFPSHFLL